MNRLIIFSIVSIMMFTGLISASETEIGKPAPDFTLTDSNGNEHSLSDYEGKFIVLEWINFGCPFVKKHYKSGNMQKLQKTYTGKDVVWLTICSSAPGKQGNLPPEEINQELADYNTANTAYLIDESGEVGQLYGAKTTPHMYIINNEGVLVYAGGIDNIKSTDTDDIEKAINYVKEGLDLLLDDKEIETSVSAPYGCSVKY
jgi:peroxiredoxin